MQFDHWVTVGEIDGWVKLRMKGTSRDLSVSRGCVGGLTFNRNCLSGQTDTFFGAFCAPLCRSCNAARLLNHALHLSNQFSHLVDLGLHLVRNCRVLERVFGGFGGGFCGISAFPRKVTARD